MEKRKVQFAEVGRLLLPSREAGNTGHLYFCKSGPYGDQIAVDSVAAPAVDETNLTVRMRISTSQMDRVNHVVNQDGIKLDIYRDNPVVLYGHGLEGITLPVAVSEDGDGNVTVTQEEDGTYAVAHHQAKNKLSMQFFDLVVQKFLRTSSIGISVEDCAIGFDSFGDEILFIETAFMNEWSYCTLPVNPGARIVKSNEFLKEIADLQCEAANRILSLNTLDGQSIHPVIRKSLLSTLETRASTPGIDSKQSERVVEMKKLTSEQIKKMGPKQLAKSMAEMGEYDEMSQGMLRAAAELLSDDEAPAPGPASDAVASQEVVVDEPEIVGEELPLGAQVLRSIHGNLLGLIETATKALGPVEADDVKSQATEVLQQARDLATSLEGLYSSKYSALEPLVPPTEEPTDEVVKSFLCSSNRSLDQLQGLAARVNMIAKSAAKNGGKLSVANIRILNQTVSDIDRLNQQAKSFKQPQAASVDESKYKQAFESLQKRFEDLVANLDVTPMQMRSE
ncbi:hypothetical protein VN12_26390 [Pirellula sp. SH-Sr6A]|uniref:hypothetical protein n=1 Tax=Pirellula sp. SH-Sr6A TaxID=1632865 RepID=UPI00078C5EC2|nr:hypothetical protein [Pirellula sp. SH-Sr6A]AMV35649.1 hypothetical protein VN12_26390 [Pirellula sp. SH-Sr6A]